MNIYTPIKHIPDNLCKLLSEPRHTPVHIVVPQHGNEQYLDNHVVRDSFTKTTKVSIK